MSAGDKVSYVKTKAVKEVFPDNPEYVWEDGFSSTDAEERAYKWFEYMKERFESFEHDKKSSIYRYNGMNWDDPSQRTIKMPNGSTGSGNYNHMIDDLRDALLYRVNSFGSDSKHGWRVFDKITGWYDVEAADSAVLVERHETLQRFLALLSEDETLARYDPLTSKEAITEIESTGDMKPIEYMFPMGVEDTNFIHYVVYEPEVIEASVTESDIEDIVSYELLNYLDTKGEALSPKRSLGIVMSKHSKALRPHIEYIQAILPALVEEFNEVFERDGAEAISAVFATKTLPETQDVVNEDKLVEIYKRISVSAIMKKVEKNKALFKRLDRIKPPSEGKSGGVSWPASAGGNYSLWITTDPFEVLTKSTGRKWSDRGISCENWDGCYCSGPASDVKYGNCIVWVYEQGKTEYREEIGRFMLRWGRAYNGGEVTGLDIGVEAQVYPKDPRQSPWGFNLLGAIGMILKDAGLLQYDNCKTPYQYKGYSDKAGGGNLKITYDNKIFLKGQGEVDVGNANALVTMASDENLSYADSGYVLNYGNGQALLALAQNPVVWIYENTIRRLFTRAMDLEEGPQIIRFLITAPVANYDWIQGALDTIEIFDDDYSVWNSDENIISFLMRSPLCTEALHYAILDSHPGYILNETVAPTWAVGYLNLFRGRLLDDTPMFSSAPADVLDAITDEVCSARFLEDFTRQKIGEMGDATVWDYITLTDRVVSRPSENKGWQRAFKKNYFKLKAMKNLLFQPNLSIRAYGKLLTEFDKMWKKAPGDTGDVYYEVLDHVRKLFALSYCLPLQESTNWGYIGTFGGISLNLNTMSNLLRSPMMVLDGEEIAAPVFSRQSAGTARRLITIFPELVEMPYDAYGEAAGDNEFIGLLLKNIRGGDVFKALAESPEVNNLALLYRQQDPNNKEGSIVNSYLTKRNYMALFNSIEAPAGAFAFEWKETPRLSVPERVVDVILEDVDMILEFGVAVVATWLRTEEQFRRFVNLVYAMSTMDYYDGESFTAPFYMDDMAALGWHFEQIEDLTTLIDAACGGYDLKGGLIDNPVLPEWVQLLLLKTDWESGEPVTFDSGFFAVSSLYEGDYASFMWKVQEKIAESSYVGLESVEILLSLGEDSIRNKIITNSKISIGDDLAQEILLEDPALLLQNYNLNIRSYMNIYRSWFEIVNQNPMGDKNRFAKRVYNTGRNYATLQEYHNRYFNNMSLYVDDNNYGKSGVFGNLKGGYLTEGMRFWRGGNFKKGLSLDSTYNAAPMNVEKGRPMALVDEPMFIPYPHAVWTADAEKTDERGLEFTNITLTVWQTVKQVADSYQLKGVSYFMDVDGAFTYNEEVEIEANSVDDIYGFIPAEDRGMNEDGQVLKWHRDVVLVFFDETNPEEMNTLPQWRQDLTMESFRETLKSVLKNPKIEEEFIQEILDGMENQVVRNDLGASFQLYPEEVYPIIDKQSLWSPSLIDANAKALFNTGEPFHNYENLLPTNMLFDVTLSEDDQEIRDAIGNNLRHIYRLQLWILSERLQDIIPIVYVYECITRPEIRADVKTRAMQIRQRRLAEYLDLMRRDEDPEVNDAEETHQYEWRMYSAEMSDILLKYCERMYPEDVKLQERLMESLIRGDINVGLEEMFEVAQRA